MFAMLAKPRATAFATVIAMLAVLADARAFAFDTMIALSLVLANARPIAVGTLIAQSLMGTNHYTATRSAVCLAFAVLANACPPAVHAIRFSLPMGTLQIDALCHGALRVEPN